LVIVGHVLEFGLGVRGAGSLGGLGVMLFFVLSGFLITGLLYRESLDTGHVSLSQFYARRAVRLFPALFCFIAVLCLLIKLRIVTDTPWYTVISCLIYVRNIWGRGSSSGHIWSLSIEEQFYLFWPCIMRVGDRRAALWIAWLGVTVVSVFRMAAIQLSVFNYGSGVFYERSWFRFDSILIGCAMALWLCRPGGPGRLQSRLSGRVLPALLWPTVLVWTLWGEAVSHVWYLTVQMALAAVILLNLLLSRDPAYLAAASHPVAAWFGRISYSWYLWQQLFTVFSKPAWLGLRTFPFNVATSLLVAVISYRFVERPFLRMRDRLCQCRAGNVDALR